MKCGSRATITAETSEIFTTTSLEMRNRHSSFAELLLEQCCDWTTITPGRLLLPTCQIDASVTQDNKFSAAREQESKRVQGAWLFAGLFAQLFAWLFAQNGEINMAIIHSCSIGKTVAERSGNETATLHSFEIRSTLAQTNVTQRYRLSIQCISITNWLVRAEPIRTCSSQTK